MNSKEISEKSGTPISTIRYYEKIGLIPTPKRLSNNYRDYAEETVFLLEFIKLLTIFHFSLDEIKEILKVTGQTGYSEPLVYDIILKKQGDLQKQITALQQVEEVLAQALNKQLQFEDYDLQGQIERIARIYQKEDF
ncbi:MerR family transcriptional regulator [Streptococcus pneumoniae]